MPSNLSLAAKQLYRDAVVNTPAIGLFRFLDYLPMTQLVSVICLVMIVIFFVTSADSGALVLNMMSAGGADDSPVFQRVLWTVVIALISASLMLKNGLLALQTATVASALPFSLVSQRHLWPVPLSA